MIETAIDQFVADGWLYAALRVTFIALIYLFLFVVLRTTVRELTVAARAMGGEERRAAGTGLIVLDAADSSLPLGAALPLEPASTLGRVAGNTIVIDDPHTSARHAELRFARGQWWLRDLGSSNGTWAFVRAMSYNAGGFGFVSSRRSLCPPWIVLPDLEDGWSCDTRRAYQACSDR